MMIKQISLGKVNQCMGEGQVSECDKDKSNVEESIMLRLFVFVGIEDDHDPKKVEVHTKGKVVTREGLFDGDTSSSGWCGSS